MFRQLWKLVTSSERTALCECRHCGATLDTDSEECPTCGSSEVAHYELP